MGNNNLIGESKTFLDLIKDDKSIIIPIIQRDYAQGRDDSKAKNIREKFVNKLFDYLKNEGENELDFIYAIKEEGKTVIIDGQQRLTTLFLLHWYLGDSDDLQKLKNKNKSKFYYETRASSTAFCNALVANNYADILKKIPNKSNKDVDDKNEISKQITKEKWFFLRWKNDPTIASMLNMLDTIHNKFKNTDKSKLYKKFEYKRVISFQFLPLENMGSSEDMYTRMNARGEPLTVFENFKAGLIKHLEEKYSHELENNTRKIDGKDVSLLEYFTIKMDTTWSDYFFGIRNKIKKGEEETVSWDDIARNIIHNFTLNHYHLLNKDSSEIMQNYQYFSHDLITSFAKFMDILSILNNTIGLEKVIELDKEYANIVCKNLKDDFKWFASTPTVINTDYKTRLRLYAFSMYISNHLEQLSQLKSISDEIDSLLQNVAVDKPSIIKIIKDKYKTIEFVTDLSEALDIHELRSKIDSMYDFELREKLSYFKEWLRVIYNLTENGIDSDNYNYNYYLELFKVIKQKSKEKDVLADLASNENKWGGFDEVAIEEEILKAKLITKSQAWRDILIEAEGHGYFQGQIGFLLHLSGISYANIEEADVAKFNINYKISSQIFDENGLNRDIIKEYRWERALLCFDDYRIWNSFLRNKHRDISWKRLLREFNGEFKDKFACVKKVFEWINENHFDENSKINDKLESIIRVKGNNDNINGWRKIFIENFKIFKYEFWEGESNRFFIDDRFLISKERMSSKHAEVYSYLFYIKHEERKYGYVYSKTWELPYVYLKIMGEDNFCLKIEHDKTQYKMSFINTGEEENNSVFEELSKIIMGNDEYKNFDSSEKVDEEIIEIETKLKDVKFLL